MNPTTTRKALRLRLHFAKTEPMRYTGHLDVQRAWERTFRRAALPVKYSEGFTPHPRFHLAAALPLGCTSRYELADVWLERPLPIEEVEKRLREALPPGLVLHRVEEVPEKAPALQNLVRAAEYEVRFLEPIPDLEARVRDFLARKHVPRERRGKTYDLRPLVEALEVRQDASSGDKYLWMRLTSLPGATGRPDEVLDALSIPWEISRVERVALLLDPSSESSA